METKVKIKVKNTMDNLKGAFAGESQANRRYLSFARKADEEGYSQIAKLFRAAAEAETVHALNHMRIMGETKTTVENLNTAISGETFEYKQMYPEYLKTAKNEENQQAVWSFNVASQVEQIHAGLFANAAKALKTGKELEKADYYVCNVCGNTVEKEPPERCQVCGSPRAKFFKIA
jgi:rubrerythrin